MGYVSLYRKYRPQSFDEVVGQRHVTQTLANAIAQDRLHHAYLFTGPRGTGKTSTARILAKAINCAQGPTAQPCQVCDTCVSITQGTSVDVIELDMASHGGVDDARELRERVLLAPAQARRKVYILDEVHMASTAAFNALLKLIEEPPAHVLFAMATTDPQKVLPTILSRVQRLDLRRVEDREIAELIARIATSEGVSVAGDAVHALVRAGEGSVRDTLSVFEQVLAFAGGAVTADHVARALGHTPEETGFEAVALLAAGDLAGLFHLVQDLLDEGRDLRRFVTDLVAHLRDLLVLQVAPERPDLVEGTAERRGRLSGQAGLLSRELLVRAVDVLATALPEMRRGSARLPLELALAKLALATGARERAQDPPAAGRNGSFASGVYSDDQDSAPLERVSGSDGDGAVAGKAALPPPPPPVAVASNDASDPVPTGEAGITTSGAGPAGVTTSGAGQAGITTSGAGPAGVTTSGAGQAGLTDVVERWSQVLDDLWRRSRRLHAIVRSGTPVGIDRGTLVVAFPSAFHAEEASKTAHVEVVQDALRQVCGTALGLRCTVASDPQPRESPSRTARRGRRDEPPAIVQEESEVREAEQIAPEAVDEAEAARRAAALLRDQLGAELVERD